MNLALFFEGTGQGVAGKITNVTRLHDLCETDAAQMTHLESGPGTHFGAYLTGRLHGSDWQGIFRRARRWFEANYSSLPPPSVGASTATRVFLFGFSRGALIARHFAAWLDKLGIAVAYLGVWDTVDSTLGLDVARTCPANVALARHAVARDEARRLFDVIPLDGEQVEELVFPGCHSDVGGLYEDNHVIADVSLAWILEGATRQGLRVTSAEAFTQAFDDASVRLHSSHRLVSNLFGALAPVRRNLAGMKRHVACRLGNPDATPQ